jgi:hypothetical protein
MAASTRDSSQEDFISNPTNTASTRNEEVSRIDRECRPLISLEPRTLGEEIGNAFNAEDLRITDESSPFILFHPTPMNCGLNHSYHLGGQPTTGRTDSSIPASTILLISSIVTLRLLHHF